MLIIDRTRRAFLHPGQALDFARRRIIRQFGSKSFVAAEKNRSESEDGLYLRFVEKAVREYKVFARFKAHPHYRSVLEHVSAEVGQQYLDVMKGEAADLVAAIERFKINDIVGSPIRFEYDQVGLISPTTLRYLKVASDLRQLFGDLQGKKIVEIGVGYGGQLLVLDQLYRFSAYRLCDLQPVLALTSRYLESHILNSSYETQTLNQNDGTETYDLVISNYAFAELPAPLQRKYIEKILSRSRCGYLTMDSGKPNSCFKENHLMVEELQVMLPGCEILEEVPNTWPDNYIVVWGHR